LLVAKRILRDPNLSKLATLKFHENVDKLNDDLMCVKGAVVTDIIKVKNDGDKKFEVELPNKNNN